MSGVTANPAPSIVRMFETLPALMRLSGFSVRAQAAAESLLHCGIGGVQIIFMQRKFIRRSVRCGSTPFIFEPEITAQAHAELHTLIGGAPDDVSAAIIRDPQREQLESFGRPAQQPTGTFVLLPLRMREDVSGLVILHAVAEQTLAALDEVRTWTDILGGLLATDLRLEYFAELDTLAQVLRAKSDVEGVLQTAVAALAREYGVPVQAWRRDRVRWLQIATSTGGRVTSEIDFARIGPNAADMLQLGDRIAVPLRADNAVWGALVLDCGEVPLRNAEFLNAAAVHTQLALAHAIAFERHRRFALESTALSDAGRTLLGYTRIGPLATAISRLAAELSDAGAASLYLEKNEGQFVRAGSFARGDETPPEISEGAMHALLDAPQPVITHADGVVLLPLGDHTTPSATNLLRGCLLVRRSNVHPPLTDETLRLLEAFATLGTLTLRNARSFEEAAEANRALADSNAFKDDLLAMFTHDFKGPLAVISGYGELVLDTLHGDERESVGIILAQVGRLARLADDALAVARAQATGFALESSPGEIVAFTREFLQSAFGRLQTRIHFEPRISELICPFDPTAMRHILENIIGNALKYSADVVRVELIATRSEALFIIRDRGIGIPAAELAQVFGRFSRASNARARGISGSGVGLYIANRLVEAHGGAIFVSSSEGEGSTFEVRLPLVATRRSRRKDDLGGAERGEAANRF